MKPNFFGVIAGIIWLSLSSFSTVPPSNLEPALRFIDLHKGSIEQIDRHFTPPTNEVLSIVAPELIRYGLFRDFLETTGLEYWYVQGGSELADFSIGPFQMKPSFVESLEKYVSQSPALQSEFNFITTYRQNNHFAIRKERLRRLQSLEWQLIYAHGYYALMDHCYNNYLLDRPKERLHFFATAYNFGFDKPLDQIIKWQKKKAFPYGTHYDTKQYAYGDYTVSIYNEICFLL